MARSLYCELPASVAQKVECTYRDQEVQGSIPGRDIPKSLKMVLVAPCLALGRPRDSIM